MHHTLFRFKFVHKMILDQEDPIFNEIKSLYVSILKNQVFDYSWKVVQNSWRYYLTFIKLMNYIITFPDWFMNPKHQAIKFYGLKKLFELLRPPNIKNLPQPVIKELSTTLAHLSTFSIFENQIH